MTDRSRDLEGRVAIVSGVGAPDGIGFATARAFAEAGASVVIADLPGTDMHACREALGGDERVIVDRPLDIASEESVRALFAFVRDRFGRLDILDNNAASQGHEADGSIADMPVELWDLVMGVNARGTMLMCKHAVPLMAETGGGSIINISSGTAMAGDFFASAYAASKGAINTLTRYVATQYGAQGIRCNALSVGLVMTGALRAGMPEAMQELFRQHNVTKTLGRPEDLAEMVAFLASDRSRYITGQVLPVDGGFYAHAPSSVDVARMMQAP